jgi:hypothetical protein
MLRSYKFKNHGIIICGLSSGWIAANPEDRQKEVVEKKRKIHAGCHLYISIRSIR